ncbi:protein-L-isoaspartate(D-aspartate) O-methyltransferase [Archangium gephyra]|uniref:Protein-L-isoaspartate O-methyltransferase n=1 Tax=Archangium gephyra TaxID=48 RepID=A0AAC8Q9F2_9BACT|nr:protein-L-isoaspartate(D-aspartate) O-methyltransferase [Archangium gephyra]AKJ03194.1 Protein-L-isoaspartate O-methyltransferase [Archangium gephyra]REG22931.1 protein-L-isoaspartate(D-aspartate) O-methyltransferase [Archangium gephyra]
MGDVELAEALRRQGISDARVLEVIRALDRAAFVPESMREVAGQDTPLPIGHGQTISQPFIVAFMTQALNLQPGERVLEIGTGSGYQTAVLARLGAEVYTVESLPDLAGPARERLERMGLGTLHFRVGDGTAGWPEAAPFDAIMGTAAPERLPPALYQQLRPGGRLVLPVGPRQGAQELIRVTRPLKGEAPQVEKLLGVRFVPMTSTAPPDFVH